MDHTSINQIIIDVMVVFMIIGGIDRLFGNRLGLGKQFEAGLNAFGPLALGMTGFVCLAPVLADTLGPVVAPLYTALGADPSMFATTLLACDMGGYPIAQKLALTHEAGQLSGILLGSMLGPTIVFSIPVCMAMTDKADHGHLATGVLCGIVTIPFGCLVGGLVAGFPIGMILSNLVPVIIISALIAIGMALIPRGMIRGFGVFGKLVMGVGTAGLIAAMVEALTGVVVIPGMDSIYEGIRIVGAIVIVLAGAYPMVAIILRLCGKPLRRVGRSMGINEKAAGGLVASLANSIPMLEYVSEMDSKGKVVNFAFMVSGAFVLGDHLGFTAGVDKAMVLPLICGKLTGGILAVALALIVAGKRSASCARE